MAGPCPKCGKSMEEGFVLDNTHGARMVSAWVEGEPETSIWVGVKLRDKKPIGITAYRCTGCGFIESYAKE